MDFIPEQLYTTRSAAARGDVTLTTPLKLSIDTEDLKITIEGASGLEVSETLQMALNKTRRSNNSGNGEAWAVALAIAFFFGLVVIFSSASYELGRRNPDPQPGKVGRVS